MYPKNWRDRYEDELLALMEARPLHFSDCLDIVLGAIDAHLHRSLISDQGVNRMQRDLKFERVWFYALAVILGILIAPQ
ncbi:hypothetical protein [Thermoflavimicrobium dichotomicum]|uniref:hypothetical protein n=1 Tax=Thermoflavimicrobium dichotomicum TaxID=46223 RepID=UPI000B897E30|nr:hypothetical protein [Thermoflavimicrobium dichotomicum]